MKHKLKATLAALATMAVLAAAMALPALAQTGVDEAWTNDMNQESYWEARFGAECTKFENHSGFIPAWYDAAVVKDGNYVRVYNPAPSPFTALGAVNPANGNHFGAPHSWVMKCKTTTSSTSSTTSSSTSSTTSTTSTSLVTTTTQPTTTTTDQTTTTVPESTTTTVVDSSTTSTVGASTTAPPSELPFTGAWTTLAIVLASGLGLLGGMILYLTKTQP